MGLVQLNTDPTQLQLRQFGVTSLVALPVLAWLIAGRPAFWSGEPVGAPVWIAGTVGLSLAILGFVKEQWLKPFFIGLSFVTYPIGLVVGELVTFVVFFLVFTPVAIFFRIIGRDALELTIDRDSATYWKPKKQPRDVKSYFRQS